MSAGCQTEGCTVGDTGICLLGNDPEQCEFRIRDAGSSSDNEVAEYVPPVLDAPEERPSLWGTLPLDVDEVRAVMADHRCLLVGVVGTPAAGKTAALVSLYLLLSHGNLEDFQFSDSKTLMAFEEISQGARRWGASPPDEMTARTETSGGRVAGFLHVQLKHKSSEKIIDFLVPDLPGEWSDALIDTNRTDRLDFLRSSDVIWVFVNGAELRQSDLRMHTLSRTALLLRRVASMFGERKPPVKIVISHADLGDLPEKTVNKVLEICSQAAIDAEILGIASFSDAAEIEPGSGISKLVDSSLLKPAGQPATWPTSERTADRFMLRFNGAENA